MGLHFSREFTEIFIVHYCKAQLNDSYIRGDVFNAADSGFVCVRARDHWQSQA